MKSIYGKLIIGFLVSILLSFSIAGYFSLRKNNNALGQMAIDELNNSTQLISDFIEDIDGDKLDQVLKDYETSSDLSFAIISNDNTKSYGNVDDFLDEESMNYLYDHVGEVIASNDSSIRQFAKSYEIDGTVYIIKAQKDIEESETVFIASGIIAIFCILIAGSIIFLVIADIIVKPISRLTKATNELSKGNYHVRGNYTGNDEIARLNRSFNQMAQQLAKQEETRQQFISDVSHEFQTPLTAISGFATILKNEKISDEQRQKYADIILFHSRRLSTLSKNMLQLTLLDGEDVQLDIAEYSLIEQLERVIDTQLHFADSKNIEIEFDKPKNDVRIEADEARLEQVWINLINNAIKYTNDNGIVTINVKKTVLGVEVSVQDTGIGMSKEAISHIFERFYRSDKSRKIEGNGLGLSIVKRIIDLHQGTIDVVSREDVGSEFTVKLPENRTFFIGERLRKDK
ncbi:MAG: HAMP domain-containing histidine kinase [Erysipelotrichaceae bacterium]|nr:HAMP domain-containing histidine kinase [Erysipelotrichaceae bacterium]